MRSFKRKMTLAGLLLGLAVAVPVVAQTVQTDDGTTLKQIIIFGRHGIRSSTVNPTTLATFSANTYPTFSGVPAGYLTPHGQQAARLLGSYFLDHVWGRLDPGRDNHPGPLLPAGRSRYRHRSPSRRGV